MYCQYITVLVLSQNVLTTQINLFIMFLQYIFDLFITGVGRKEGFKMPENKWLAEEIVREASKIPLESQKHILSVINAMIFTRQTLNRERVMKKDKNRPQN